MAPRLGLVEEHQAFQWLDVVWCAVLQHHIQVSFPCELAWVYTFKSSSRHPHLLHFQCCSNPMICKQRNDFAK